MFRRSFPVMKAVAYHPTVLFIPPELAGLNVAAHVMLMMIVVAVLDWSPIGPFVSAIVCHVLLIFAYMRDNHIVSLARAIGGSKHRTRNIIPTEGVRYVP